MKTVVVIDIDVWCSLSRKVSVVHQKSVQVVEVVALRLVAYRQYKQPAKMVARVSTGGTETGVFWGCSWVHRYVESLKMIRTTNDDNAKTANAGQYTVKLTLF